jgi:casein kinase II subunit beta
MSATAPTAVKYPSRIISYDGFQLYAAPCPRRHEKLLPWIIQFCSRPENRWFAEVPVEYVDDRFNGYGLQKFIPNIDLAREMICDHHALEWFYLTDEQIQALHDQAKHLYGLIHARWICTSAGLTAMAQKIFRARRFGVCPRFHCKGMPLMPVGLSPLPNRHSVKLFCGRCVDVYNPPVEKRIDGAYFGPAFPSVFLVVHPNKDRRERFVKGEQTLFGFKIRGNRLDSGPHASNHHLKEDELNPKKETERAVQTDD